MGLETRSSSRPLPATPYPSPFSRLIMAMLVSHTPTPRCAPVWAALAAGNEAVSVTPWSRHNPGSEPDSGRDSAARLVRTISLGVRVARPLTRRGSRGNSSGAPPVMSMAAKLKRPAQAMTASTVSCLIASALSGPASRWQWRQARSHVKPTLICRVEVALRVNSRP